MTISIDLAALRDWETGAPDPDPNTDTAFIPDQQNWPDCPSALPGTMSLFDMLDAREPVERPAPPVMPSASGLCLSCGGTGENNLDRDGRGDGTPCRLCSDPDDDALNLVAPWRMSIEALDSWVAYYRSRLRGLGRGCGALTPTEETHRAEVEGQVNSRHEARRHSAFPR
jgi:hypothetical protein